MEFLTINATAKKYGLPANMLRQMQKRNSCPGFYASSRFYVNVPLLLEKLEADSKASMKGNENV